MKYLFAFLYCLLKSLTVIGKSCVSLDSISLDNFSKYVIPSLEGKAKGDNGKILFVGGSREHVAINPYKAAISAALAGGDLIEVLTTESMMPILQSRSIDFLVYPYMHLKYEKELKQRLQYAEVIVIGPGAFGPQDMELYGLIIRFCKDMRKPLILDAGALLTLAKDISMIENYPSPGVILTPDSYEATDLIRSAGDLMSWKGNVSVLLKGKNDTFFSSNTLQWSSGEGGSPRRTVGQGDILAGFLGTFYNWALKSNLCDPTQAHSIAAFAAAKLTRECNAKAFAKYGRSMLASKMIDEIHVAFEELFKRV